MRRRSLHELSSANAIHRTAEAGSPQTAVPARSSRTTPQALLVADHHRLEEFGCGAPSLDRWLKQAARTAAAAATAAVYVLCRGDRVIAYCALAMASVEHAGAPARLRRGMPDPVPVVLLARLAVDRVEQRNSLGGHLLVDALRRCVRGGREYGARAVIVDAIDEQAAGFCRHFDFRPFDDWRLWRRLSDISRAVGRQAPIGRRVVRQAARVRGSGPSGRDW